VESEPYNHSLLVRSASEGPVMHYLRGVSIKEHSTSPRGVRSINEFQKIKSSTKPGYDFARLIITQHQAL
jgi:hypothetical protein